MCTEEFALLTVDITDSTARQFVPDEYFVIKSSTGDTVLRNYTIGNSNFGLVIFTDSEMRHTNTNGENFKLMAYKSGVLRVDETYKIRHDECHIKLVSGKTDIQL